MSVIQIKNIDMVITRHAETYLNSLIYQNNGYSKMEWETCQKNKQLTAKGLSQASRLGSYLNNNGWIPDIVFASTSERTIQTSQIIAKELGVNLNSINFIISSALKETCCFEYIIDHIPNHEFANMSSYEEKIVETKEIAKIFLDKQLFSKKVLFVGHELRNTFLMDYFLGKTTNMNVPSVCFPNCGIQLLSRDDRGQFIDAGGVFSLEHLP